MNKEMEIESTYSMSAGKEEASLLSLPFEPTTFVVTAHEGEKDFDAEDIIGFFPARELAVNFCQHLGECIEGVDEDRLYAGVYEMKEKK